MTACYQFELKEGSKNFQNVVTQKKHDKTIRLTEMKKDWTVHNVVEKHHLVP